MLGEVDDITVTENGIKVLQKREDRPKFERIYQCRISPDVRMEVACKTYPFSNRSYSGELTQNNGRYVLFEPDRPADKILDRDILPVVERRCREIIELDKQFLATKPRKFIDEQGHHWMREGF